MEHQKLVERLRAYTYWLGKDEPCSRDIHPPICDEAADAISALLTGSDTLEMFADATKGVPLNRVREIIEAERGGRLVVLPDTKYTDADGEEALRAAMWKCNYQNNPVTRYTADAIAEKLCREVKEDRT